MTNIKLLDSIKKAAQFVKNSQSILIGAGAGMGKDSGMPDFRGNQGFWNNYPVFRNRFQFIQCANPQFLSEHPHLFWAFYGSRLKMYRQTRPHLGFQILKQIANTKQSQFVITSNVDGHFNQHFKQNVFQVHGTIHYLQCTSCKSLIENNFIPDIDYEKMYCNNLPQCEKCGQVLRPNILMFDDWQWDDSLSQQQSLKYEQFCLQNNNKDVIMMQFGCGTAVPTVRKMMQVYFYRNKKSKFIRVNPDDESNYEWMDKNRFLILKLGALQSLNLIKRQLINQK